MPRTLPPKPKPTAAERRHARTLAALDLAIHMFDRMQSQGALRLPFPGYPEAMKVMRAAVEK
jgi:hypothetical protein